MDELDALLARRVRRGVSDPADAATVDEWSEQFGPPERVGGHVPALMFPTFVRPPAPPADGAPAPTGVVLHDELKSLLGLPVAIAVGYELELRGGVQLGERLVSTEGIASLGGPRRTRFGEGRDWVIEVVTDTTAGAPVGVERFRMLGYRPDAGGAAGATEAIGRVDPADPEWIDVVSVGAEDIVRMAAVNRVWAPAHHRTDAARAAGLPDIILDTSSQVAILAGAAQRRRPSTTIRSVDLVMRRPILPGAEVRIGGFERSDRSIVVALVDGREVSRATVVFAA